MTFDYRKWGKYALIIINYSVRIALAAAILMCVSGALKDWDNFQVYRQWNDHYEFQGLGTLEQPYLINNAEDLVKFSDAVNNGNYFEDIYFRQTADIDLSEYDSFTPIGTLDSGYMFCGIYDGGGHTLSNLNINGNELGSGFVGLFGKLGGVVMNLGIESGRISGDYVGSFASTDGSTDAMIVNCYNRANLYAIVRCGGIAENFSSGRILGCANYGHLSGMVTCQLVSYNCAIISGCCNLKTSHDYIVPYDTFAGHMYDCYIGTDDITELNRFIENYADFMNATEIEKPEVIPWESEES